MVAAQREADEATRFSEEASRAAIQTVAITTGAAINASANPQDGVCMFDSGDGRETEQDVPA